MTRVHLAAIAIVTAGLTTTITSATYIVRTDSTHRFEACVENGGSYVHVSDTTAMECQR